MKTYMALTLMIIRTIEAQKLCIKKRLLAALNQTWRFCTTQHTYIPVSVGCALLGDTERPMSVIIVADVLTPNKPQAISNHHTDSSVIKEYERSWGRQLHYCDAVMGAMVSQIISFTIVYSAVHSDPDQRKHQSSASLAFVRGIHRRPVNSPRKWPVTWKMFPFDDVIMESARLFVTSGLVFSQW